MNDINMNEFENMIFSEVYANGGTNFEEGYNTAVKLFVDDLFVDNEYTLNSSINTEMIIGLLY